MMFLSSHVYFLFFFFWLVTETFPHASTLSHTVAFCGMGVCFVLFCLFVVVVIVVLMSVWILLRSFLSAAGSVSSSGQYFKQISLHTTQEIK